MHLLARALTLVLQVCLAMVVIAAPPKSDKYIPAGGDQVPDQYIVVLADDVLPEQASAVAHDLAAVHGASIHAMWKDTVKGFFATMPEARARALSSDIRVKYVEENATWHLSSYQQTNINPVTCDPTAGVCSATDIVTDNRLWHLDRADHNVADANNQYSYCTDGTGVTVYVIDTGVNKYHQEFAPNGARIMSGYNSTGDATTNDHMPADDPCLGFAIPPDTQYTQEGVNYIYETALNGHGTGVASALGGNRVGIAKNVTIVPIKVIRCDLNSSRVRHSDTDYALNKTMFFSSNSSDYTGLYRVIIYLTDRLTRPIL